MNVKYYLTSSGRSPVEEFILELPEDTRLEIADAVALLEGGQGFKCRSVVTLQTSGQDFMSCVSETGLARFE